FELPRREAELAVALNEGLSIAEAAERMGLTLETARNYSKRLYAKLGVRGQAQLVRLVSDSVAVMA
ncbi:MAG: helix-turn-helix transcriptional regulator, partial [Novosphingobium sp.]